jgi:hypothetical protein
MCIRLILFSLVLSAMIPLDSSANSLSLDSLSGMRAHNVIAEVPCLAPLNWAPDLVGRECRFLAECSR